MSKRKNKYFWDSAWKNNMTYIQYFNRLMELSIAMFEWKNLPDTVDPRYLELKLFKEGQAVFFKDEVLDSYFALGNGGASDLSIYGIPNKRRAIGQNGRYSKNLDYKDSVLIYNNLIHTNSVLDVEMFAKRLYEFDRAIDVNVRAQKTPILIRTKDSQRLTLENVYMQYDGNKPVIFATENFDPDAVSVLKTDAPFVSDKLYQLKTQYWNEALTYLGISNINITKKERLITDEVTRNQGGTVASRYSRLESRRMACKQINKMFGLDVSVDYREDLQIEEDVLSDFNGGQTKDGDEDE